MEVVSGTASILQLLAAAITVTEATLALLRAISDAPRELQEIAIKVSIIQSQLQQLDIVKNSIGRSEDRTLSPEFKRTIELSLAKTRVANVELQNAIRPLQSKGNLSSRVHWALLDRSKVVVVSQRLQTAEQSLSLSLRILEIQISLNLNTAVLEVQQDVDDLLTNVDNVRENLGVTPLGKTSRSLEHSTHYYLRPSLWNGRGECHMYTGGRKPRSTCTIDIPLPLPFRGSRVLRFKFGVQHLSSGSWGLQLENVTLSVKRLVPDDSNIIRSCKGGDLVGAQKLLRHGRASVDDVTSLGLTPLMCAIESGNLDFVQFLIAAGADVKAHLDHCSTNTLQLAAQHNQLDVFRRLLVENVDGDHVDRSGWTVAFYLWPRFSKNQEDWVAFLKLLHQYDGCDFAHQASGDWTALHRATNFGSPSDISTLVRYGASVSARAWVINWTPIHYATIMGNTDVVKELARPEYNLGINVQDARGWSPLHVAAYVGAYPTLCTLLALGADAELKSWQVGPGVAWRVTAKDVAAVDLARLRGEKQHRVFLQALQAVKDAGPEDAEMFWDAVETI